MGIQIYEQGLEGINNQPQSETIQFKNFIPGIERQTTRVVVREFVALVVHVFV
jgi:hypothetical protein